MAPFCVLGNKPPVAGGRSTQEYAINFHSLTRKLYRWGFRQFQYRIGCGKECSVPDAQGLRCRFLGQNNHDDPAAPSTELGPSSTCEKRIAFRHPLFHRDFPDRIDGIKNKPNRPLVKLSANPKPAAVKRAQPASYRDSGRFAKKKQTRSLESEADLLDDSSATSTADQSVKSERGLSVMQQISTEKEHAPARAATASPAALVPPYSGTAPISHPQSSRSLLHPPVYQSSTIDTATKLNDLHVRQVQHLNDAALLRRQLELEQRARSLTGAMLAPTHESMLRNQLVSQTYQEQYANLLVRNALAADRIQRLQISLDRPIYPVPTTTSVLSQALVQFQERPPFNAPMSHSVPHLLPRQFSPQPMTSARTADDDDKARRHGPGQGDKK
jgi:hypothetical protein